MTNRVSVMLIILMSLMASGSVVFNRLQAQEERLGSSRGRVKVSVDAIKMNVLLSYSFSIDLQWELFKLNSE